MGWAITQVGRHWVWTVWLPTERRTGVYGSRDLAEGHAGRVWAQFLKTSSVELPAHERDSAEQRTPGTPDSHDRKDCST